MANEYIREAARRRGVRFWQIADVLGISEATFTRKLRHELSEEEQAHIMRVIDTISNGGR